MPVLAACSTCTPLLMPSRRLLMSLARESSEAAVKKLVGLSSAVLTFLPVARRLWVVESRSAVDWRDSRFWRTEAERTIEDITHIPFWCVRYATSDFRSDSPGSLGERLKERVKRRNQMPTFGCNFAEHR